MLIRLLHSSRKKNHLITYSTAVNDIDWDQSKNQIKTIQYGDVQNYVFQTTSHMPGEDASQSYYIRYIDGMT